MVHVAALRLGLLVLPVNTGYHVPYSLYAMGGLEDVLSFMWASLVFALVLASPIVIWQIWAFIAAGLYPHERRVFYRYFPFMIVLMAAGVAFGYLLVSRIPVWSGKSGRIRRDLLMPFMLVVVL